MSKKVCVIRYRTNKDIFTNRHIRLSKVKNKLGVNISEASRRIENLLNTNIKIWKQIEKELIKEFKEGL